MTSLTSLKNILYKLKEEEIRSLINFINYNQKVRKNEAFLSVRLIKLILSEQSYSANELQIIIYLLNS